MPWEPYAVLVKGAGKPRLAVEPLPTARMAEGESDETEEESNVLWSSLLEQAQVNRAHAQALLAQSRALHLLTQRAPGLEPCHEKPEAPSDGRELGNAESSVTWPSGLQVRDCQVRWRVVDGQKVQEHQDRRVSDDANSSIKTVLGTRRVPSVLELLVASETGKGARDTVAAGKAAAVNAAADTRVEEART